jgi:hypothetical protein
MVYNSAGVAGASRARHARSQGQCALPNERWQAAAVEDGHSEHHNALARADQRGEREIERTTRVAAWSAVQDRLLLVQRWQGTKIAELNLPNKTPVACAHRWKRFHAKVLDATMLNLPEHASSDFVAELSDLMSDHAWWDAVEEKHTELLNDRASDKAGALPPPSTLLNILNPHSPPKPCRPRSLGSCGRRSSRSSPGSSRSALSPALALPSSLTLPLNPSTLTPILTLVGLLTLSPALALPSILTLPLNT